MQNQIPKNWQKVKLGDILIEDPQYGYTASSSISKVGPKLLRITDIQGDFVNWDDVPYCEIPDTDKQKYLLIEGDIVFARTGNTTGANYFIKKLSIDEAVFASYLIRLRPDPIKCLPGYLAYFLRSKNYWKQVNSLLSGSAQPGINATLLKEFTFDLPNDIKYQRDIVSILSAFDEKIEVNNKIAKTLEEMTQALFKEWFVHFRFPGYEKVKMVDSGTVYGITPEGWKVRKLGDKLNILKGKNITKNTIIHGKVPVVAGGLNPAYYHNKANAHYPVITISASGANSGFVNLYQEDVWASDCSYIDRKTTPFVYFYYLFLKNKQTEITGLQRGSAQPHVYPKDLMQLTIIDIPEVLTNTFEHIVELIFGALKNLNNQNQCLQKTRDLLLPKLMKGEIRV